ncbi:SPARC-like protein 1 [Salmo trutta]|uniref:SPARC-like protein 1 n=1 Tax=Salmo trutta TaxID=8032 RepID=UPI0011310EE5|nr:SPARC-like protein 1 [Salmo trutta]
MTFESSSQEQEDEDMSYEDNASANVGPSNEEGVFVVSDSGERSTPVLLSNKALVDLLQGESEEEEVEEEEEEEEEGGKIESEETQSEEEEGEGEEEAMEDEEESVEDEDKREKEDEEEHVVRDRGVEEEAQVEETDSNTEPEIPEDLDYASDRDNTEPLETEPEEGNPLAEDAQLLSNKKEEAKVEEKEKHKEDEIPTATDDYESQHDIQDAEASKSQEVQYKDNSQEKGTNTKTQTETLNTKRQRTVWILMGHIFLRGSPRPPGDEGVKEHYRTTDSAVYKPKRRRAPLVGMNPVQIKATVDLYPSARPSLAASLYRPQASAADPCENFRCKRGKTCKLNKEKTPMCVCQEPSACPQSVTDYDHVCGTDNVTYDTSCELFATKCNLEGTKRGHRLHLDYTGPCKFIAPCMNAELVQFPLRMRDWLKNVLLHLYEHDSMSPGFLIPKQRIRVRKIHESERRLHAGDHPIELLAQDFEKNYNMYIYPVHWQFAQMDQHPSDRFLSHSELAPLRVPLVPMEHCTSRFFQECDADKDKQVSFREWTHCFGIKDEDMDVNLLF